MTVKWDGAYNDYLCGINPENGKFFVGTKSVFNKIKKLIIQFQTSIEIIVVLLQKNYNCMFNISKRVVSNGVYQGDLLFTSGDLKTNI